MAILTNNSSGLFSAASTWSVINPVAFPIAWNVQEFSTGATSVSFLGNVAFTPGAITIDGIGVKVSTRAANQTLTVRLAQAGTPVAGTTVTSNTNDLPTGATWAFFKFSSPVTLLAATTYQVQTSSSAANAVTLFRKTSGLGDWTAYLRTTTNQAPAAGDGFITTGELLSPGVFNSFTVTMDNTSSTLYGNNTVNTATLEVGHKSTFEYGTDPSTNYQFRTAGDVFIGSEGVLKIGDAVTPMPESSSGVLEFVTSVNVQYGLQARTGTNGTIITHGAVKAARAYLASDAAVAATSITSDVNTNWLSGDSIVLASTTRTVAQTELKNLTANAAGNTLPISALTFAHSGTNPTRAELANITRNVRIRGTSASLQTYILANATCIFDLKYTEFSFMGAATASRRGIECLTTTGSFMMSGCSLHNFEVASSVGLSIGSGVNNVSISDCVFYRISTVAVLTGTITNAAVSIMGCWAFTNLVANNTLIALNMTSGTYSDLVAVSSTSGGIVINSNSAINLLFSNMIAHSNGGNGIQVTHSSQVSTPLTIVNSSTWSNNVLGFIANGLQNCVVDGLTAFSNLSANLNITNCFESKFNNVTLNAGATLPCPTGINLSGNNTQVYIDSSSFGASRPHSSSDLFIGSLRVYQDVIFRNCLFASTTELSGQSNMTVNSMIGSSKHDQVVGAQRMWKKFGTITLDSALFVVQAPSQRLTPNIAVQKLNTQERRVAVPLGKSVRISTNIRKSVAGDGSAYNGAQPRLILIADPSSGITSDTVLATSTAAGNGAFERITGTTPAVTANTVLRFYVDCSGTAGFINIDRWSVEVI